MHYARNLTAAALLLAACSTESTPAAGETGLSFSVDSSVQPAQAQLGERALARMVGESGVAMDFVLGELLVHADDASKVEALAARWGGRVLARSPDEVQTGKSFRVAVDTRAANVAELLGQLQKNAPEARGSFRTSNEQAAQLLAVAFSETNLGGVTVTPNFVAKMDGLGTGSTIEGPLAGHSSDTAEWSYMNRGSVQDIGVTAAWEAMVRTGAIQNKITITVIDGGFAPTPEFPQERSVLGDWNSPNLGKCTGGHPCPWHGNAVVGAAMGTADNRIGGAGPAAPVARLIAVPMQQDFFSVLSALERMTIGAAAGQVINMSWGFEVDRYVDDALKAACLFTCPGPSEIAGTLTSIIAGSGKLLFASAGNLGENVDEGGSRERATDVPCELPGVHCIGGLDDNSIQRAPNSNWGSATDDNSVDMYGPYCVYGGPDPDNPGPAMRWQCGTSYSAPFVAGVAALTWAANPSRSAQDVWRIMRETAHRGGIDPAAGNTLRVNAFGAVTRALSPGMPSVTLNAAPTAPLNRRWVVTALATDEGAACPSCRVTWDPPPESSTGNTATYRFTTAGPKTVRAIVTDVAENRVTAETTVEVVNSPPVVRILAPSNGASVQQGVPVQILGEATDINEGADPGPGRVRCDWSSSNPDDRFPGICNGQATFSTVGTRTVTLTGTDLQGLLSAVSVEITVTPPPANLPPVIWHSEFAPPPYEGGYPDTFSFVLDTLGTYDPEGDTPITFEWSATSYRPNSNEVYRSLTVIGAGPQLEWSPASTAGMIGRFPELGNACYDGQEVQMQIKATDALGNSSVRLMPRIRIYGCQLL